MTLMADTDKKSNTVGFKSRGSTASLKLRAIQPDGTASELFLVDGLTIGRTNANALQACDDEAGSVERSHARVDFEDSGSVVLKCLQPNAGVDTSGGTVSTLKLEPGTAFKIGRTEFEVVAGPTAEQVSLASGGRGCPYCGHADLPEERGVATRCSGCGNAIVVVSPDQNLGVPTFLPGVFHDVEARKYAVERFVARGGMGYVLKGEVESGTAVAIKVLILDGNTHSQAVSRFKQEIDLLRKLHDPNVLRLISHGQEAGLFFFVMDWVDGHDLRSELPKPGKPETYVDYAKARDWFEQACEGLSTIHRAGAVHRDIKPSNLLLTREGKLLIADLGVAKQLNGSETSMTCTGQLPGTYFYMAPEQHYAPDLVDQRSDIYSLGFTFWELLTGVRPNGVNPSHPSSVNRTVPKEFDDILLAMLANSIEDRPSTMREILRSLPPPISRPLPEQASVAQTGSTADKSAALDSQPPDKPRPTAATKPVVQTVAGKQSSTAPDYIDRLATALRQGDALAKEGIAYLRPRIQELVAYLIRRGTELLQAAKAAVKQIQSAGKPPAQLDRRISPHAQTDTTPERAASRDVEEYSRDAVTGLAGDSTAAATKVAPSAAEVAKEQEAAVRHAELAKAKEDISQKLQAAIALPEASDEQLDALKTVRRALTLIPAAIRTPDFDRDLRPAVDGHLSNALRRRGDDAFAGDRYGIALSAYEELRHMSCADELVMDRIDQIITRRKAALSDAKATIRRGHLSQAKEQLIQLQTNFIGDAGFVPECEQLLARTRLTEQRIKETIPALRATKSLFRMSKMLEELASEGLAISGLDELLEKTRKTLSEGSRRLDTARDLLGEGRVEAARKVISDVRSVISDHPAADELSGKADAEEKRQNVLVQEIQGLARQGNFLRVHRQLKQEEPTRLSKLGLTDLLKQAATHKRRSDRFIRMLVWAVGGTACVLLASFCTDYLWSSITSAFTPDSESRRFLESTASGRGLRYALFVLSSYLALYGLRELVARSRKTRLLVPDVLILLVIVGLFCAVDVGQRAVVKQVTETGTADGVKLVNNFVYWMQAAGVAAIFSAAIATFCRIGVDIVLPKAVVPLRPAILFAIAIASYGVASQHFGDYETRVRLSGLVPSTLMAMAAAATVVSVRRVGLYGWPLVACGVGFMFSRWMGFHEFKALSWGTLLWQATLAGGVFLGLQNRTRTNAIVAAAVAFSAVLTTSYVLSHDNSINLLNRVLPWAAACVIVPTIAQTQILRRIDVSEALTDILHWLQSPAKDAMTGDEIGSDDDAEVFPGTVPAVLPLAATEAPLATPLPTAASLAAAEQRTSSPRNPRDSQRRNAPLTDTAGGGQVARPTSLPHSLKNVAEGTDSSMRLPLMSYAGLFCSASLAIIGVCDALWINSGELNTLIGFGLFASLMIAGYAVLDKYVISRGRREPKTPVLGRVSTGLIITCFVGVAIGQTGPAVESGKRAAREAERASNSGQFVSIDGTPFKAQIPPGWHQMPAPDPLTLFTIANASEDVRMSFLAAPVINIPVDRRDPQGLLQAWLDSLKSSAEDFELSSFTAAEWHGDQASQCTLDATLSGEDPTASKSRVRFVSTAALSRDYLCQVVVYGVPSQVIALSAEGVSRLLETVQPVTP
jgi:serine/threonine protein kinase